MSQKISTYMVNKLAVRIFLRFQKSLLIIYYIWQCQEMRVWQVKDSSRYGQDTHTDFC